MEALKILIIGDSKIGKTIIKNTLLENQIVHNYSTIGVEYDSYTKIYKGLIYNIHLYDCGGNKDFKKLVSSYFNNDKYYIICFNATDINFKKSIEYWIGQIKKKSFDKNILLVGIYYSSGLNYNLKQKIINFINDLNLSYIFLNLLNENNVKELTNIIIDKNLITNNYEEDTIYTPLTSKKEKHKCLNCVIV